MIATIQLAGREYRFDPAKPIDISIPLNFNGPQPNAFGVDAAVSTACVAGEFVGDTRRGGSVNFEQYTFIPHCNGTHTECVGHITHERIAIIDCLQDVFIPALLISIKPEAISNNDRIIDRATLESAVENPEAAIANRGALMVRTLPNDDSKLTKTYGTENIPPYFSPEAMEYVVECGFKHLLVDMPSIDRIFDDGKLVNHRLFWNVEPGSFKINENTRKGSTVTELIYVPPEVEDGEYLLNLQIAPFRSDASPSRPVIFKTA